MIPISVSSQSSPVLSKNIAPVWFSGVPQAFGNSPYLVPILKAPAESFSGELPTQGGSAESLFEAADKGGEGLWAGSSLGVVTGFQTASGGRITWLGGVDLLTDELFQKELPEYVLSLPTLRFCNSYGLLYSGSKPGNAEFARQVAAWTFQENLILRVDKVEHHLVNATEPKEQYTINDNIVCGGHLTWV